MSRTRLSPEEASLRGSKAKLNASRERVSNQSAEMEGGRPTRPGHLSKTAKKEWNRVVKLLLNRGTLTKADASILEVYCETYSQQRECLEEIERSGAFETDPDGYRVETAASKKSIKLGIQLRALLVQMGLTPAAREKARRVQPPAPPKTEYPEGSVGWLLQRRAEDLASEEHEEEPETENEETSEGVDLDAALAKMEAEL